MSAELETDPAGGRPPARRGLCSAIDTLQLPLGNRDRTLRVLAPGAVVGEHVDDDEVGDRGRRLLADRTEPACGACARGDVAERRGLRIGGPYRVLVVSVEAVRQVTLGRLDPRVEVVGL